MVAAGVDLREEREGPSLEGLGPWIPGPRFILSAAAGVVGIFGEVLHQRKKRRRLADEKTHVGQKLDHALGNVFCLRWANDGAPRQIRANEGAWLRHD